MANLDEISKAVIKGEGVKVSTLTKATLDVGIPAKEILDNALVPGIQKWVIYSKKVNNIFCPSW